MKPQSVTVDNLLAGLRRLHPRLRKTRLLNWALLVWGLLRSRSAMIPAIAAHLPLAIQAGSRENWRQGRQVAPQLRRRPKVAYGSGAGWTIRPLT